MLNDRGRIAAVIAGAVLFAGVASAQPRIHLAPASTLELNGKSTMHDFESRATKMDLAVELAPALPAGSSALERLAAPGAVKSFVFTIPVESLRSSKDGLDKNLYKALKSSSNPNITFRMTGLPHVVQIAGRGLDVTAIGDLEVAGQSRSIDLAVRATTTSEGLVVEGRESLLMSDYGIKPPTMMLGAIKTQDRIEISFRLLLTAEGF
jgi:hypothetical protein